MEYGMVGFWEKWLTQKFLPMMQESLLHSPIIYKVYTDATEQRIYTVQFKLESFTDYATYQKEWEQTILKQVSKTFAADVACFTSLIQEISLT